MSMNMNPTTHYDDFDSTSSRAMEINGPVPSSPSSNSRALSGGGSGNTNKDYGSETKPSALSPVEPADSLRYAIFLMDKKIRNLEKKKAKVEKYSLDRKQGKELNDDQLQAINRLEETVHSLLATRDMKKQFEETYDQLCRSQKRQTKKAIQAERDSRRLLIDEILCLQSVLNFFENEFLHNEDSSLMHAIKQEVSSHCSSSPGGGDPDQMASTIMSFISQLSSALRKNPNYWLVDDESVLSKQMISLFEGRLKPISDDRGRTGGGVNMSTEINYAIIKSAVLGSIKSFVKDHLAGVKLQFDESTEDNRNLRLLANEGQRLAQAIGGESQRQAIDEISLNRTAIEDNSFDDNRKLSESPTSGDPRMSEQTNPSVPDQFSSEHLQISNERLIEDMKDQSTGFSNINEARNSPPTIRSLTFTNRNYTLQQMNPQTFFNYELPMDNLNLYDEDLSEQFIGNSARFQNRSMTRLLNSSSSMYPSGMEGMVEPHMPAMTSSLRNPRLRNRPMQHANQSTNIINTSNSGSHQVQQQCRAPHNLPDFHNYNMNVQYTQAAHGGGSGGPPPNNPRLMQYINQKRQSSCSTMVSSPDDYNVFTMIPSRFSEQTMVSGLSSIAPSMPDGVHSTSSAYHRPQHHITSGSFRAATNNLRLASQNVANLYTAEPGTVAAATMLGAAAAHMRFFPPTTGPSSPNIMAAAAAAAVAGGSGSHASSMAAGHNVEVHPSHVQMDQQQLPLLHNMLMNSNAGLPQGGSIEQSRLMTGRGGADGSSVMAAAAAAAAAARNHQQLPEGYHQHVMRNNDDELVKRRIQMARQSRSGNSGQQPTPSNQHNF